MIASPELRANRDAWLGPVAAPDRCNQDDENLGITGEPDRILRARMYAACPKSQHGTPQCVGSRPVGDEKCGVNNGIRGCHRLFFYPRCRNQRSPPGRP